MKPPMKDRKVDIMLDSGAFTAWQQGLKIELKEYMQFIEKHSQWVDCYFNLDTIAGRRGQPRTPQMVEEAAKKSYETFRAMKKAGFKPIPVYHQQERSYWLEKLLDDGEQYIALSTMKELTTDQQAAGLDQTFTRLTDKEGRPLVKLHGLGVASLHLVRRYPWFSCDATSWALLSGLGCIFVPPWSGTGWNFAVRPIQVRMTDRAAEATKDVSYMALPPDKRKLVQAWLHENKLTVMEVCNHSRGRRKAMICYMRRMAASIDRQHIELAGRDLFHRAEHSSKKVGKDQPLKIVFAVLPDGSLIDALMAMQERQVLLSYAHLGITDVPPEGTLKQYVETGVFPRWSPRRKYKPDFGTSYITARRVQLVNRLERYEQAIAEGLTEDAY